MEVPSPPAQTTGSLEVDHESRARDAARRPKPQLSSVLCRSKKLKCDRAQPCKNCMKRPAGSCVYVPHNQPATPASSASERRISSSGSVRKRRTTVHDRIQRLERLVASLADAEEAGIKSEDNATASTTIVAEPSFHLAVEVPETRFVGASHWEAILEDIAGIKDDLYTSRSTEAWDEPGRPSDMPCPQLLFGNSADVSFEELLCSLPSKTVADELLDLFKQEIDLPLMILHIPTFLKEYDDFWRRPRAVSLPWLSFLYSIMSLTLQYALSSRKPLQGVMLPEELARTYTMRSTQCLVASDYAIPTAYTLEAMMLNQACEHYWLEDNHFKATLVLSMIVRLAYRLGYHRDPRNYPHMSIFEGEMRRRVWYFIIHIDLLLASKTGLPRTIDERQADTSLAIITLSDDDLSPDMTELPTPRPQSDTDPVEKIQYKTRLLFMLVKITDSTSSPKALSYDEVIALDKELSVQLRTRPASLELPSEADIRRISSPLALNEFIETDVVVQRARMVLHRKYLIPGRTCKQYSYSRETCLSAAMQMLRYQNRLYELSCDSNGISQSNWRFISIISHDFLLAAMLICLALDHEIRNNGIQRYRDDEHCQAAFEECIELLRTSYQIWTSVLSVAIGARKGVEVLGIILGRIDRSRGTRAPQQNVIGFHNSPACEQGSNFNGSRSNFQEQVSPTASNLPIGNDNGDGDTYMRGMYPPAQTLPPRGFEVDPNAGINGGIANMGLLPDMGVYDQVQDTDQFQMMLQGSLTHLNWTDWGSQFPDSTFKMN